MNPGNQALWCRRGHRPRPVFVLKQLPQKVRIVDLVESTHRKLVMRDVMPGNLVERKEKLGTARKG